MRGVASSLSHRWFALLALVFLATVVGCGDGDDGPTLVGEPQDDGPQDTGATTDVDVVEPEDTPAPEDIPDESAPDAEEPDTEDVPDTGPELPPPPPVDDFVSCDAGDEAWVKRSLPVLLGRAPRGVREVRVLADMIAQTDRATVARGLMNSPEFAARWAWWLMDELRVNRVGDKKHPECYGAPLVEEGGPELAEFIRDNPAHESDPGYAFNMTDVLHSSLALDDLSPLYRAHLFAMMQKPITGANVGAIEMDITRRQDFGEIFEAIYLHRNVVCVGCHNANYGVTDNPDPEKDRHWPLNGKVEAAVYGKSSGIPEMELYSIFRRIGVVKKNGGARPWSMHATCGRFTAPGSISDDPAKYEAFFIEAHGLKASVWDTESALQQGFDAIRIEGLQIDEETAAIPGPQAFAYMVSVRIVNRLWREVLGYPLTLVHYIPRNQAQRDILQELTDHFIAEQWSLKTVLTDILTHPLYNENASSDGCGDDNPYLLPAVFNPWVLAEEEENKHKNSPGDVLHRHPARVMLNMVSEALGWAKTIPYPNGVEESFQKAVGVFVKDAEPGFDGVDFQGLLTWENRYGACPDLSVPGDTADPDSCVGICEDQAPGGCHCDAQCIEYDDCCDDYLAICVEGVEPDPDEAADGKDWIGALISAAKTHDAGEPEEPATVRDVVAALKDRLITEPDIGFAEAKLLGGLFGVPGIDAPLSEAEGWEATLRSYCGILLESPQFLLTGAAAPDQITAPALSSPSGDYEAHCVALSSIVFPADAYTVECTADSLVITKTDEGEPGDPEPDPEPEP